MAGFVDESTLKSIKDAVDIVDLVSGYYPLKKAGSAYKMRCPFHEEKTPSFIVTPSRQMFKCFGCGVGGDVFSFLMKQERIEFPEAVEMLAERAGITLHRGKGAAAPEGAVGKEDFYKACEFAAKFYEANLAGEAGKRAREYITSRNLSEKTAKAFRLGYALPGGRDFVETALSKNVPRKVLTAAGLAIEREGTGELADRFHNRLMFPIQDVRGRVVAFGARAMDDSLPKYINSSESALFSKGRCLYGLNLAKEGIAKSSERVIIVEGYMDLIMCWQFGFRNVVASMGTSLTPEQVGLLKRFATETILIYDSDDAGLAAAERSLDIFLDREADVRVATLAEGLDPCDFLLRDGHDAFAERIALSCEVFDFKLESVKRKYDFGVFAEKRKAIDEMMDFAGRSPDAVRRSLYRKKIAEIFRVSEGSLVFKKERPKARRDKQKGEAPSPVPEGRLVRAEYQLAALVCRDPAWLGKILTEVGSEDFSDPLVKSFMMKSFAILSEGREVDPELVLSSLGESFSPEETARLRDEPMSDDNAEKAFRFCVTAIKERTKKELAEGIRKSGAMDGRVEHEYLKEIGQIKRQTARK